MTQTIAFLNANAGALSVLFTAIVTLATVVYAGLTWRLVRETRMMREVQTEPKLEVVLKSLDIALHIVRLHIANIGLGPALDVRFKLRSIAGGKSAETIIGELMESNFLQVGLAYFGPGQERFTHYTQLTEDHDGKLASIFALDVAYRSSTGKTYKETFTIDMSEFKGTYQLGRPHMYSIAQSLEKLQQSVDRLATGSRRLKADVYTNEDRADEAKKMQEWREQQRAPRAEI
jgi:hypothetical protein